MCLKDRQDLKCNGKVEKLNVNRASFKELVHHPYLKYEDVKKIFKYKDKNGVVENYKVLESLIGAEKAQKLRPYVEY